MQKVIIWFILVKVIQNKPQSLILSAALYNLEAIFWQHKLPLIR